MVFGNRRTEAEVEWARECLRRNLSAHKAGKLSPYGLFPMLTERRKYLLSKGFKPEEI